MLICAQLHYRDGLEFLGEANAAWLSGDALHPTPDGYENMGQRYYDLEFSGDGRLVGLGEGGGSATSSSTTTVTTTTDGGSTTTTTVTTTA